MQKQRDVIELKFVSSFGVAKRSSCTGKKLIEIYVVKLKPFCDNLIWINKDTISALLAQGSGFVFFDFG